VDVIKSSATVPVSRDLLLDAGVVEPTPVERAEMDRQRVDSERRAADRKAQVDAAREQLAAVTDPLARAVLDLHHEDQHGRCAGDEFGGYDGEPPAWPCDTVIVVARHFGIVI
jgi:hypothetical protein